MKTKTPTAIIFGLIVALNLIIWWWVHGWFDALCVVLLMLFGFVAGRTYQCDLVQNKTSVFLGRFKKM